MVMKLSYVLKNIVKLFMMFAIFFCFFWVVRADLVPTITSNASWGSWNSASTWVWGVVPWVNDVVEINGVVTIYGNTTVWWLLVSSWATLKKYNTSTYYTLTINWDLENNWTIWWNSNTYASYWYIHAKWDILNNGVLSYVNKFYSYWNVINTSISSTNTDIFFYVTDTWTTPVRRLETSTNFKPKLYINWDVTLTWSIDFKYQLFLQNHELYVDWTEDLYFSRVHWWWWWKILSSNWNWDWEKLKIWTVRSTFETNIEDTEIVW